MVIEQAKEVLRIEAEGLLNLIKKIDDNFIKAVELIFHSKGRVIIGGIGKSGLVGQKIVATLNSTGTRALFLHPVEAMHGDLGMVGRDDIFLAISNSGETEELNILAPSIKQIGCSMIAFTGGSESTLARLSDIVIDVGVKREACPLGLAPTASTTAVLAMGDALAVALINKKHFNTSDFKRVHPGGTLGHRLSLKVSEVMLTGRDIPCVFRESIMKDALSEINRLELGVAIVTDRSNGLLGIITDGDIRRAVLTKEDIKNLPVEDIMTGRPRTADMDSPLYDALNLMEEYQITVLPVTDKGGRLQGILHLHDILGKGAFKFNGAQH